MTQPDKPVPAKGTRPQLFGDPGPHKPSSKPRHPDFGPSILATIDGSPRRDTRTRDGAPLTRVLWMSVLALGVVAVYFAVKFGLLPTGSSSSEAPVLAAAPVAVPASAQVMKVSDPVGLAALAGAAASAASANDGAASIENVAVAIAAAPAASAGTSASSPNVAASLNNVQQALARADGSEPRTTAKPEAPKERRVVTESAPAAKKEVTAAARPVPPAPTPTSTNKSANDDAELLAAMLPHLKRKGSAPTSPAFEKRCGQLSDDALVECRVKFCNGREGVDPACPSAVSR
ncbi:hypothetical protein [Piscinibacter sp. HJYY11]|uniref:hypothetical protein n=1 Tax=Piscinibacter sp. HJYY11 TaxID=2801333 RepID=UPI00191CA078|nr:hypothetical protein [Piscinibacter sp. HJYY11]MBL0730540.1 hypothetical protein [Piscinibacter sp. HJYY11]